MILHSSAACAGSAFELTAKDPPNVQIVETAITDKNGAVLQGNRWWLTLRDGDMDYDVDMGRPAAEGVRSGSGWICDD